MEWSRIHILRRHKERDKFGNLEVLSWIIIYSSVLRRSGNQNPDYYDDYLFIDIFIVLINVVLILNLNSYHRKDEEKTIGILFSIDK